MVARSILRFIATILGAVLFFPISCTTALTVGTQMASKLDARDITQGDEPHTPFFIAVSVADKSPPWTVMALSALEAFRRSSPDCSFLLPQSSGSITLERHTSARYIITESSEDAQTIEVRYSDNDKSALSRYKASRDFVRPLYSRLWYHGYMFKVLPFALVFACLVLLSGRLMRRKWPRSGEPLP